jgi:hypothetical protein
VRGASQLPNIIAYVVFNPKLAPEGDHLDVLATLIEAYEEEHHR